MKPRPRQPRNYSTAEKAHDKPSEAVKQILPADEQRANKRASNKQLAVIWKLWNALPATLSADERRKVLTGAEQYQVELKALRKNFPKVRLPLDESTLNKALEPVEKSHDDKIEAVTRMLLADEQRANEPASDKQLAAIWPLWNALPATLSADERRSVLTGAEQYQGELKALRKQFPKAGLPLDESTFNKSLEAAHYWHTFQESKDTTSRPEIRLQVEAALHHDYFRPGSEGRVAAYRTVRELEYRHPKLLNADAPTLAEIQLLKKRHDAYLLAQRDFSRVLLLLFSPQGAEDTEPSAAPRSRAHRYARATRRGTLSPELWKQFWSKVFFALNPDEQRAFVTEYHKPAGVPGFHEHLSVARLLHFRKCPDELRERYMTTLFPKLAEREMKAFLSELHRPSPCRAPRVHLQLWAWLLENAPVFSAFETPWREIYKRAQRAGLKPPTDKEEGTAAHLKTQWHQFARRHGFAAPPRISPPEGAPPGGARSECPESLLTPSIKVKLPDKP